MSSDLAIKVQNVSKHYLIYKQPEDRFKQMVMPKLNGFFSLPSQRYYTDFTAVQNVNLEIGRGETVGIIGRNGSGKSTLLQMICGTLQPSSGSIAVNGRIAALLELGSGFNPEFTGRENVKLNCAILGLSHQETEERFAAIEDFAGIGMFIDQAVKTYSSGMYVRLAFAVAINVDPDILVVDEALAVGDEAFQRKCYARLEQIRDRGATILFVSHGAQTIVQLCDRAILLDRGEILMDGAPKPVVQQYQRLVNASPDQAEPIRAAIIDGKAASAEIVPVPSEVSKPSPERSADSDLIDADLRPDPVDLEISSTAKIQNVRIETEKGQVLNQATMGRRIILRFRVKFDETVEQAFTSMSVRTVSGLKLFGASTRLARVGQASSAAPGDIWDVSFTFQCNLTPGVYFFTVAVGRTVGNTMEHYHRIQDAAALRIKWQPDLVATGFIDANILPSVVPIEELAS